MVTTSSTSSTLSPGLEREAAAQLERCRSGRSTNIASTPSARPISWPMMIPPIAGETTMSISLAQLARQLLRQRGGQPAGAVRVHQHARALQVMRAVAARGEQEMPFEQGLAGAEFGENLVVVHRSESCPAIGGDARPTGVAPRRKYPLEALEAGQARV